MPRELVRQAKGGEVNLNMEDHRQEDFVAPKVKVKAFSGTGNMLGRQVLNCNVSYVRPILLQKYNSARSKFVSRVNKINNLNCS